MEERAGSPPPGQGLALPRLWLQEGSNSREGGSISPAATSASVSMMAPDLLSGTLGARQVSEFRFFPPFMKTTCYRNHIVTTPRAA